MYTMMTSKGSIEKKELIERVEQGQLAQWFEEQTHIYFGEVFKPYIEDMNNGTITANQLEHLRDAYIHQYFFENRLDAQGPLLVLKYIFGKENEINNLRLVLTGHANGIAKEKIQERMGAIQQPNLSRNNRVGGRYHHCRRSSINGPLSACSQNKVFRADGKTHLKSHCLLQNISHRL